MSTVFKNNIQIPSLITGNYFPSLDGFRAMSIIIVLIGHYNFRWGNEWLTELLSNGHLGVAIFFVISGFLITTLLIKEKVNTGTISLRKFYIRRFIRIFPVAYLYLLVIFILGYFFEFNTNWIALLGAALYLRNFSFVGEGSWYVNHYWSLSAEEQFYLIFPFLLKWNIRRYIVIVLCIVFLTVILNVFRSNSFFIQYPFVFEFLNPIQGILVGSIFSFMVVYNYLPLAFMKNNAGIISIVCILLIIGIHNNSINNHIIHVIPSVLSSIITYVLIGILILTQIQPNRTILYKFLNWSWMRQLGILSYSIYIWQQLFTVNELMVKGTSSLPWYAWYISIPMVFIVGYLSYHYYEKPFNQLKNKFK